MMASQGSGLAKLSLLVLLLLHGCGSGAVAGFDMACLGWRGCRGVSTCAVSRASSSCRCRLVYTVCRAKTGHPHESDSGGPDVHDIATATNSSPRRGANTRVRQLMQVLQDRLELSASDPSWKKTKQYLYRTPTLDARQVHSVLDILLLWSPQEVESSASFSSGPTPLLNTTLVRHVLQSSPRLLRKHARTHIQPTLAFLVQLFGTHRLSEALVRNPDLLLTRGTGYNLASHHDSVLGETLVPAFLQQDLGMTDLQCRQLRTRAPHIWQTPLSQLLSTSHYLLQLLAAPKEDSPRQTDDSGRAHPVLDAENVASSDDDTETNPHREQEQPLILDQHKRILIKIILANPSLLLLSVERNIQPRVEFLQQRCHLSLHDVAVLVKSASAPVLGLSVEDNLAAKLDLMQATLSGSERINSNPTLVPLLRKSLLKHPPILGLGLDNLQAKIRYFQSLHPHMAQRLLERAPAVYSLSLTDNLQPKVRFLAAVWGASDENPWNKQQYDSDSDYAATSILSNEITETTFTESTNTSNNARLGALLYEYPTILTLSLNGNLQPTVDFFNRTGYIHLDAQWRLQDYEQVGFLRGRYMAASLYQRLLPRWHFAQSCAVTSDDPSDAHDDTADVNGISNSRGMPLHVLVSGSDAAFCDNIDVSVDEYESFKATNLPRLKFSDQFANWLKTGRPIEV